MSMNIKIDIIIYDYYTYLYHSSPSTFSLYIQENHIQIHNGYIEIQNDQNQFWLKIIMNIIKYEYKKNKRHWIQKHIDTSLNIDFSIVCFSIAPLTPPSRSVWFLNFFLTYFVIMKSLSLSIKTTTNNKNYYKHK